MLRPGHSAAGGGGGVAGGAGGGGGAGSGGVGGGVGAVLAGVAEAAGAALAPHRCRGRRVVEELPARRAAGPCTALTAGPRPGGGRPKRPRGRAAVPQSVVAGPG